MAQDLKLSIKILADQSQATAALGDLKKALASSREQFTAAQKEFKRLSEQMAAADAPTSEMSAALAQATHQVEAMQTAVREDAGLLGQFQRALSAQGPATRQVAADYDRLKLSAGELRVKLQESVKIDAARGVLGIRGLADTGAEIDKVRAAFDTLKASGTLSLGELASAHAAMQSRIKELRRTTDGWTQSLEQSRLKLVAMGLALAGAFRGLTSAGGERAAFDKQIALIATLTDKAPAQLAGLGAELRQVSQELGASAKETAAAAYDIVSSGVDVGQAVTVVKQSTKAAVAGVTDVQTASKVGLAVLNSYGYGVERLGQVYDVLFQTVNKGVVTFPELANQLGDVLPIARSAGVSLEEVGAAIAQLTVSGIRAPLAVTSLKQAILQLSAPTPEAIKSLDALGIHWNGLVATLEQIKSKNLGLEAIRRIIPDVEGADAVLTLTQNVENFRDILTSTEHAAGAFETAFGKIQGTDAAAIARFDAALENLRLTIGKAVLGLTPLIDGLTAAAKWFSDLPSAIQVSIGAMASLGAVWLTFVRAIGPAVTAIASLLSGLGGARLAASMFGAEAAGVGTSLLALATGPVGILIGALVGVGGLYYAWQRVAGAATKSAQAQQDAMAAATAAVSQAKESAAVAAGETPLSRSQKELSTLAADEKANIERLEAQRTRILSEQSAGSFVAANTSVSLIDRQLSEATERAKTLIEKLHEVNTALTAEKSAQGLGPLPRPVAEGAGLPRELAAPGGGGTAGGKAYNEARAKAIIDYLVSNGVTPIAAAGIVGNLIQEAGPDLGTALNTGDGGTSGGIAQWHKERHAALVKFAQALKKPAVDLQVQLDFLLHEANARGDLAAVNAAQTPGDAARIFSARFERPAAAAAQNDRRVALAEQLYGGGAQDELSGALRHREQLQKASDDLEKARRSQALQSFREQLQVERAELDASYAGREARTRVYYDRLLDLQNRESAAEIAALREDVTAEETRQRTRVAGSEEYLRGEQRILELNSQIAQQQTEMAVSAIKNRQELAASEVSQTQESQKRLQTLDDFRLRLFEIQREGRTDLANILIPPEQQAEFQLRLKKLQEQWAEFIGQLSDPADIKLVTTVLTAEAAQATTRQTQQAEGALSQFAIQASRNIQDAFSRAIFAGLNGGISQSSAQLTALRQQMIDTVRVQGSLTEQQTALFRSQMKAIKAETKTALGEFGEQLTQAFKQSFAQAITASIFGTQSGSRGQATGGALGGLFGGLTSLFRGSGSAPAGAPGSPEFVGPPAPAGVGENAPGVAAATAAADTGEFWSSVGASFRRGIDSLGDVFGNTGIGGFFGKLGSSLLSGLKAIGSAIGGLFSGGGGGESGGNSGLFSLFSGLGKAFMGLFAAGGGQIAESGGVIREAFAAGGAIGQVRDAERYARESVQRVREQLIAPAFAAGGQTAPVASGLITGPGTGTSDSIAMTAPTGAFIVRAVSVARYGRELLHRLAAPFGPAKSAAGDAVGRMIRVSNGEFYVSPEAAAGRGAAFWHAVNAGRASVANLRELAGAVVPAFAVGGRVEMRTDRYVAESLRHLRETVIAPALALGGHLDWMPSIPDPTLADGGLVVSAVASARSGVTAGATGVNASAPHRLQVEFTGDLGHMTVKDLVDRLIANERWGR